MSSTAGPEDRMPRRAREENGTLDREARIHDARQDGVTAEGPVLDDARAETRAQARAEDRAEARAEDREQRANETRAIPAAPLAGAAAGSTAGAAAARDNRVIHGTRDDHGRHNHDVVVEEVPTRETVVAREKEQFGGVKVGSAFFGWLTATGMAVLLTALVAAAGTAVGVATQTNVNQAATDASKNPQSVGVVGGIALLVILFVAYYCGGYVAGRMARFNGTKQGLAVWLSALLIAVVVAVLG